MLQDLLQRLVLPGARKRRRWALAGWVCTSVLAIIAYQLVMRPDLQLWPGIDTHGDPARRQVALTFDDGPDPLWAPLLADTLEQHGARGTFFLVGTQAQRYPELTARLARHGHEVASHSMTHPYPNLTALPPAQITREIADGDRLLAQLTGKPVTYFRPPGGGVNNALIAAARANKVRLGWWSVNVGDWSSPAPEVVAGRLHSSLRPGLIVLMHQRERSVSALACFLAGEQRGDYTYTTMSSVMRK